MFEKKRNQGEEQNFWISYADLMAGLLFVFILLVGAIVIKYVFIQTDLQAMRTDLIKEKEALNISDKALAQKKQMLKQINKDLKKSQEESLHLSFELAKAKTSYKQSQEDLKKLRERGKRLNAQLDKTEDKLQLSEDKVQKINAILLDEQNKIALLNLETQKDKEKIAKITKILEDEQNKIILQNKQIETLRDEVATKIEQISLNIEEIEKLKLLLLDYELKEKSYLVEKKKFEEELTISKNVIHLKGEELALLEEKLLIQSKKHQKLVEEFDITKVKIKNLTGVRIKVVAALRDKLGKSIDIDPQSGALTLASNILFDQGQYRLKEGSKQQLGSILEKYIHTLLLDEDMRQYIDNITIEGYTNSDGTYMNNLKLSQKRALEVMRFLYGLNFKDKKLLEQYISASGRSYSNLVYDENSVEDKNASRRIEIKFRIRNEQAIKELENFYSN